MAGRDEEHWATRLVAKRVEKKGLRPRLAAAVIAILWVAAIVVFGIAEHLIDPGTFDNIWLGMWWATQTVTTVGYGDVVPDQAAGQIVGTILMVGGLSFFAVVTGTITSAFVTRAQADRRAGREDTLMKKLNEISGELEKLKSEIARRP
jgi:voltage-gated potassium channel